MATVRLVDEAKNLYKLPIVVVAMTPFIFVVTTELFWLKERELELIMVVVPTEPARLDSIVLPEDVSWLLALNEFKVSSSENNFDTVALVIVELFDDKLLLIIFSAERLVVFMVSELVVELLVVEAFKVAKLAESPKITVKYADKPEIAPDTKFSIKELVVVEFNTTKLVPVAKPNVEFST